MIRCYSLTLSICACAAVAGVALANPLPEPEAITPEAAGVAEPAPAPSATAPSTTAPSTTPPAPAATAPSASQTAAPASPAAGALRAKLDAFPTEGNAQELKERAVLSEFYAQRADASIWVTEKGLTDKGSAIVAEIMKAGDWGLEAKDFALPHVPNGAIANLSPAEIAEDDVALSLAVLKYTRFARGGRIIDPTILLTSEFDRKPQLIDPERVIKEIAAADAPDVYLRGLNPKQPQFEKLRQAYLGARNKSLADKLRANMEEWRWMPDDMGEMHILANIPEFMVHLYKHDNVIHSERIVVGEVGKQTTIFSRNLKTIVFKPMWRVPESIKVRELQPNLRRGGSMFRQYDLELETKDGQPLDYTSIDWRTADIRNYEVVQPPGRKNVMGVVKFTFPSQHTIFMHDTVDKWMFNQSVRMLSHGCLRLRNPMKMAELVLAEDKGWDAAKVQQTESDGARNNEIIIEHKIPMHLVYFTAWVDDDGKLRTYRDIYGHEKRIALALAGRWSEIDVGRDHLAAVEPAQPGAMVASGASSGPAGRYSRNKPQRTVVDIIGDALGGGF
jgi:L,D-transpeptidase YcbB